MTHRLSVVCFDCKTSKKVSWLRHFAIALTDPWGPTFNRCHHCGGSMVYPGNTFHTPKKDDAKGWADAYKIWCDKRRERFARRARRNP